MIELVLIFVAVAAVISTRWEQVSQASLRLNGALSLALGLRIAAIAAASYLVPSLPPALGAQQPGENVEETPLLEAEGPASARVEKRPAADFEPAAEDSAGTSNGPGPSPTLTSDGDSTVSGRLDRPPVPRITNISYLTTNRPSWIETGMVVTKDAVQVAVRAGPYARQRDCLRDLEREIGLAVADFTNQHLESSQASTLVHFSLKDLRARKVVRQEFSEQLETSVGLMNQVHAQLVFDQEFQQELDRRWGEIKSKARLAQTGLGTGIVLLFLGTLFSFLKLDTATKGYYTGRLQFAAAATILALVVASVVLTKWIPWM